jgi:UDP-sugar transporter A1/2/3
MVVLAVLYAMQNIVALFAYDYVDVATYQIVYQLKIITTAMFMIVFLNRRFSKIQWCAMLTLMLGVAICSYSRLPKKSSKLTAHDSTRVIGVCIVFGLAINSGLAAAYFERVMKSHKSSALMQTIDPLWIRNLQLSAVSILVTLCDLLRNYDDIYSNGFFYGFHPMVWAVIFLQAVGGLTIAAVVRFTDNVVKNFGTSFSLIFSCIISNYMFDQRASPMFYVGVILVVISVFIYGDKRYALTEAKRSEKVQISSDTIEEIKIESKPVESNLGRHHFLTRAAGSYTVLRI